MICKDIKNLLFRKEKSFNVFLYLSKGFKRFKTATSSQSLRQKTNKNIQSRN